MSELIYKEESYKIIGLCMEVHRELGKGHDEIIYKDALEYDKQTERVLRANLVKIGAIRVNRFARSAFYA
jgi:GxxExxY protein